MLPEMCMAIALFFEARSEEPDARMMIAETIINRVNDKRFPSTVCKVVFQNEHKRNNCAFSFACDGKPDRPQDFRNYADKVAWKEVQITAKDALEGKVTFHTTSNHYHRTDVTPYWVGSKRMELEGQVGRHIFYTWGKRK